MRLAPSCPNISTNAEFADTTMGVPQHRASSAGNPKPSANEGITSAIASL